MIDDQKIQKMHELASRVVGRCELSEPMFGFQGFDPGDDFYPRNIVTALTEGRFRGRMYAVWIPIHEAMYRDESYRDQIKNIAHSFWRQHAIGELLPIDVIQGPKGTLPA